MFHLYSEQVLEFVVSLVEAAVEDLMSLLLEAVLEALEDPEVVAMEKDLDLEMLELKTQVAVAAELNTTLHLVAEEQVEKV
jgi:hypothetical protein|tara:strand:+ start:396 stop:638 length:243 start_codon:yes stop_codon:yes gene_type:complete